MSVKTKLLMFAMLIFEFIKNFLGLRRVCDSKARLDGKVVVITGANTGIGKETAYQLSLRGAKVIIGCRHMKKAEEAVNHIKEKNPKSNIIALKLDLSSLTSVRQFVRTVEEHESVIDILVNNAGVMACPEWQTEDGFEMQFGTNHLGHFLLTLSLLPLLRKSSNARIITVSSMAYIGGQINFQNINLRNGAYTPAKAYCQSKLANVLFTTELARRLGENSNVKTYCLHPGVIKTELGRYSLNEAMKYILDTFMITIESGAQTTLYCALEESIGNESGLFYEDCHRVDKPFASATDDESALTLWQLSSDLVKLENHLKIGVSNN